MTHTLTTSAYWVARPGEGELRRETVAAEPPAGLSLLHTVHTGVSPGTERLVGLGLVPASCAAMACQSMAGRFPLPVKYGYSLIGVGVAGALKGRRVFAMHPHQGLALVDDAQALALPDALPDRRALLIPNLETALNAVWDADLGGDEPCIVIGGGIVGLLVAYVLWRTRQQAPAIVEIDGERRARLERLPWIERVLVPGSVALGAWTVAFHATGVPQGLQAALDAVGVEGRVIDLSWYGSQLVTLDLGTRFHPLRQRIVASQVGQVAPAHRTAEGKKRRLDEVVALLGDASLDALLGPDVPFAAMPELMAGLYAGHRPPGMPVIDYAERS